MGSGHKHVKILNLCSLLCYFVTLQRILNEIEITVDHAGIEDFCSKDCGNVFVEAIETTEQDCGENIEVNPVRLSPIIIMNEAIYVSIDLLTTMLFTSIYLLCSSMIKWHSQPLDSFPGVGFGMQSMLIYS